MIINVPPPVRPYIYIYNVYARANKCVYVLQHKTQNFRPNYLSIKSVERTFALLLVPREKKFEKSFIL
jgi:transposase-like protein